MKSLRNAVSLLLFVLPATAVEFHVSPGGAAGNTGTEAAPFSTIAQARDAIRALKQSGTSTPGATVLVHGGDYWSDESTAFTAEDSGAGDG